METESQRPTGVLPAVFTVPTNKFEAARVRRVDGQEVPDYPQPFNLLADAEKYVAGTPVSIDGTRAWIRNATSSRISGSFLMVGGRWLQSEPSGVVTSTTDETPMQNATRGLERAFGTQHPQFDRADHRREVDCGDTRLFDYWEWVVHQLEADEASVDDVVATQEGRQPKQASQADRSSYVVYKGYFGFEGTQIDVEFQASIGATVAEKDAAFMAVLAQKADIDYHMVGE